MIMESNFYYEMVLHRDDVEATIVTPWVSSLSLGISNQQLVNQVAVLSSTEGRQSQGLYLWDGSNWRFGMPYENTAFSIVRGDVIDIYYQIDTPVTVSGQAILWRNGILFNGSTVAAGDNAVWVAQTRPTNGLVASVNEIGPDQNGNVAIGISDIPGLQAAIDDAGKVKSVNEVQPDAEGNVQIGITDIAGLPAELSSKAATVNGVGPDGSGNVALTIADIPGLAEDLAAAGTVKSVNSIGPDANGNVVVPGIGIATTTTLGSVIVPASGGLLVDGSGNLSVNVADLPIYVQSVKATTVVGGYTLINDDGTTSHDALLKQLLPGANITLTSDANGITINSTSTPPGVEGLVAVQSEGNGTSLVDADGTATGIATIKSIAAGSNVTITPSSDGKTLTLSSTAGGTVKSVNSVLPDGSGNIVLTGTDLGLATVATSGSYTDLTNTPTPYSLPAATASILGGVKIGTNITVAVDGTISVATGAGYVLPIASVSILGGVKIGSGINVAGDGTISNGYTLPIATTTVLGGVKQGTNVTIAGDGTLSVATGAGYSLPIATASVLGGVKIGSGINVTGDGTISAAAAGVSSITSEGSGVSVVGSAGGAGTAAILRSIAPGSNITVVLNAGQDTITINAQNLVSSVAGRTGAITLTASDIGGLATVATSGSYTDLLNKPTPYSLPIASSSVLGGVKIGSGISIAGDGTISATAAYTLPAATTTSLGGVVIGSNISVTAGGTISVATGAGYSLPLATATTLGGVKVGTGLQAGGDGTISIKGTLVSSVAPTGGTAISGDVTFTAGSNMSITQSGQVITFAAGGGFVTEAPNDGNLYGRENLGWTLIPSLGSAITSVTGQTGTGAIILVETSPPANSAIIKSLVAGSNVTITESGGLVTINASVPGTPVTSVNTIVPDGTGNVTLTAANIGALPTAGGAMTGAIDMQGLATVEHLITPVNPGDAVPLSFLTGLGIDGGTY